jgi:hypothetical protein
MTPKQYQTRYLKQQLSRMFNLSSDPEKRLKIEKLWTEHGFSGRVGGRNRKTIQTKEQI